MLFFVELQIEALNVHLTDGLSMYFKNMLIEILHALVINVAFISWTWMLMAEFKPTQSSKHSSFQVRSGTSISFIQDACGLGLSVHLQCIAEITDSPTANHAPKPGETFSQI